MGKRVYAVHATRPDDVGSVEAIFGEEQEARAYALDRSTDPRVLAASVTGFQIGVLGSRDPVAFYRDGALQDERKPRPGSLYPVEPWASGAAHD